MKTKKTIVETICFLLVLNFFYEGVYKVAYLNNYAFWVTHEPLIKPIGVVLKYLIPIFEITISILLLISSKRKIALWTIIVSQIVFIGWIVSVYLFTHNLFWPYHALWDKPTWMQKMCYGLLLCWLSFTAIFGLELKETQSNKNQKKLLFKENAKAT